jgi:hypothetical protein
MRGQLLIVLLVVLLACNSNSETVATVITTDSTSSNHIKSHLRRDYIDSLVREFDVDKFIRVTNNLNSGVSDSKYHRYKPDTAGYYYHLY